MGACMVTFWLCYMYNDHVLASPGLCRQQQKRLVEEVEKAWQHGTYLVSSLFYTVDCGRGYRNATNVCVCEIIAILRHFAIRNNACTRHTSIGVLYMYSKLFDVYVMYVQ